MRHFGAILTHTKRASAEVAQQVEEHEKRVHRINVNFSPEIYSALEALASSTGKSMADVLRDAIGLEKYVHDTRREGGKVYVERAGRTSELLVR